MASYFRDITSSANKMFSRAQQYTEEKLGQSEKTEYEDWFETTIDTMEKNKIWTERIIDQIEKLISQNASEKIEGFIMSKIGQVSKDKLNSHEILAQLMRDAAIDISSQGKISDTLVKVAETESYIGKGEKERNKKILTAFLQPLKSFLDVDYKNLQREKKSLDNLRLDLDSARNKANKSKPEYKAAAIVELNNAQVAFDRQFEITKMLLQQVNTSMINTELKGYIDFVDIEIDYHSQQAAALGELKKRLSA